MTQRSGAQLLVDQLILHAADTVFCVPGESYLRVLDALFAQRDSRRLITARQEGGAAYMAEAYGKLTGQPGICFVTRGPGASNASIGVHTAFQDSTPLILFIGQVPRSQVGRDAFQEVDYRQMFAPLAKWVMQIDDARRIPEFVSRAFHLATSGRPGPVVLVLPEDMQGDEVDVPDPLPYQRVKAAPTPEAMQTLRGMLVKAQRPLLLVGREGESPAGIADLRAFATANQLPAVTTARAQDMLDNRSPTYAGSLGVGVNPVLLGRVREADLLLVVGSRLDGLSTAGYSLLDIPRPQQTMVHVYPDPAELGRIYQADLLINATQPEFAAAARALKPVDNARWSAWRERLRQDYETYRQPPPAPGAVNLSEIVAHLSQQLPPGTIITTGAGNYTAWVQRFFQFSTPRTLLGPISGAMGYGVPAAVAAKIVHPERVVVSFSGDGCFLMNGQELATAMHYGLAIIFIVVNNGIYGTIRMHQERHFPGRVYGTSLTNPNFADYARAFGASGEVVKRTADFAGAFERALRAERPVLIELRVDPEAIMPGKKLSELRTDAKS
ncbi:MAG: thiamine pyrophosphate-binding protein [Anaerolineae bacterium]|nr:thiamine pyrophosphate-binding protein [Anaerolineae bacterium]